MTVVATVAAARALADEGRVREAIGLLTETSRTRSDGALDAEMIQFRHEYFSRQEFPTPPTLPPRIRSSEWQGAELAEFRNGDLDEAAFRREMAHHGCVLVRGLVSEERAATMRDGIDRALAACDADEGALPDGTDWFRPFIAHPKHGKLDQRRKFMRDAGSLWAVDSPRMFSMLLDMLDDIGIASLVEAVLGERPALSANKFNLRRVPPGIQTNWHQDGAFLGEEVRSMNLWLALSDCGVDAPGLDIVPRRIDRVVETGTHEAIFNWSVAQEVVDGAAGEAGVVRPRFGPGDALIFDHLFLHRTAQSDEMTKERYAIETWFFAPSEFPEGQMPILL